MQISEIPKFLNETTHAIQLVDPLNAAHPHVIPLQKPCVTSYFNVQSSSIAEYEKEELPKIYLTADDPHCDQEILVSMIIKDRLSSLSQ